MTLFGARLAAVRSARGRGFGFNWPMPAAMMLALSGCMPATAPLAGTDPADPSAKIAQVGYRSTIAPYTSLRPSTPVPWRERNDEAAPQPKPER